jgi:uncharacterized protein
MNIKTISGYLAILILSFLLYSTKSTTGIFYISLPILMFIFPVIAGYKVKMKLSIKDLSMGLVVSVVILLPYYFISGGNIYKISGYYVFFQLLSVALPEEFFFRGFLQDSIGKNFKTVLIVSLLFSVAHLPKAIFVNDWVSLLSFFPSIVMGWLYMKTDNILPGTMFHLFANLVHNLPP